MRKRVGNPSNEAHGKPMRCYDWFAPPGTNVGGVNPDGTPQANSILKLIEDAVPGLKLYNRGDGIVNGFVNTSTRPDGSVYICVHLYDDSYAPGSSGTAPGITIQAAPNLNPGQENQIALAVGERPGAQWLLKGGNNPTDKANDRANLQASGFSDKDSPMKDT